MHIPTGCFSEFNTCEFELLQLYNETVNKMTDIPALLFDMDGVILDSMPWHVKAWQRALAEFGCSVRDELLYLHEGAIEPATAAEIFHENGCRMDEERFLKVLGRQIEIFNSEYRMKVKVYRQVPDMLADIRRDGRDLAVVTSSHSDILQEVLPPSIRKMLSCIITGDRVPRRKPWPDPYLAAMRNLGQTPSNCCVIENAPAGIESARSAGMKCIAIKTTLDEHHLQNAHHIVDSHHELHRLLCGKSINVRGEPLIV